ncbi:MAG: hypothetical protein VXZ87_00610 [Bacteroidota bacterium]|nr:hypothetical protein [Bacteroidota bacterium]
MYWKQNKDCLSESYLNEAPPRPRPNFGGKPPKKKPGFFKRLFGDRPTVRPPRVTTASDNDRIFELIRSLMREIRQNPTSSTTIAREFFLVLSELTSSNSQSWQRFLRGLNETNWQFQNDPDELLFFLNNVNDYFANLRAALSGFMSGDVSYAQLKEQLDALVKIFEDIRGGRYYNPNFDNTARKLPDYMRDLDPEIFEYIEHLYDLLRELQNAGERTLSR